MHLRPERTGPRPLLRSTFRTHRSPQDGAWALGRTCLLASFVLLALLLAGCTSPANEAGGEVEAPAQAPAQVAAKDWAVAIHGGAGVIPKSLEETKRAQYFAALESALQLAKELLDSGQPSLDVVEQVVRQLEDEPLFNAGRGAVFTSAGTHELDASIMDGSTLACGAVSGVTTVRHPVTLARKVMEQTRHIFLVAAGAEAFADQTGVERVEQDFFYTQRRYDAWQRAQEAERAAAQDQAASLQPVFGTAGDEKFGTVGVVALDRDGNLAAATSTGGLTNKRFGRVGDSPLIGAGTYANNATCAISATGLGEQFIRHNVAHDVSARMEHGGDSLQEAAEAVIHGKLQPQDGGIIGVDRLGNIALVFNSDGMFRGAADSAGRFEVAIWESP